MMDMMEGIDDSKLVFGKKFHEFEDSDEPEDQEAIPMGENLKKSRSPSLTRGGEGDRNTADSKEG